MLKNSSAYNNMCLLGNNIWEKNNDSNDHLLRALMCQLLY